MIQIIGSRTDNARISDPSNPRVAVITGAAHGIGAAVTAQLLQRQYALVLVDRDHDALQAFATAHRAPHRVLCCPVDVRDPHSAHRAHHAALQRFGRIDDVLLFAGTIHTGPVEHSTVEDQIASIETNLIATIRGVTQALPILTRTGTAPRILTIASAIQAIPYPGYAAYIASKAGVRAFTATVRNELLASSSPVTISCGVLGGIDTHIVSRGTTADPGTISEQQARFTARVARTSPARAAELLLAGFDRRKPTIRVGVDAHLAGVLQRVVGGSWRIPARFQTQEETHD